MESHHRILVLLRRAGMYRLASRVETGCYPQRVGLARGSRHSVLFPTDPHGLNPSEVTIAEVLRGGGYASGCFGKWHLGDQPQFLPTAQGFDTYFGIPYSNDMWPLHRNAGSSPVWMVPDLPLIKGTEVVGVVADMEDQAELCRQFTEAAVEFIREHKDEPFFLYLPHAFVHQPRGARREFLEKAGAQSRW